VILVLVACASLFAQTSAKKLPLVAVMPLTAQGVDSASAQVVSDVLSNELLRTGKVRVMERSQMEKILKEQGFQQSGSCDGSECAVEMGKLLSIDKMVVGSLGKLGGSYSLSLRAVDVDTGEIVGSTQKMQRGEIDEVSANLIPGAAKELALALNPDDTKLATLPVNAPIAPDQASANNGLTKSVRPEEAPGAVSKGPAEDTTKKDSSSHWGWWVAGGVVVAGGATAAVLLLTGKNSTTSASSSNTDITARWSN
jgi:hypothetical protein